MALTYSVLRQGIDDRNRWVEADVTFDTAYTTGGMAVSLASVGLKEVRRVAIVHDTYPDAATSAFTQHGRQIVPVLTSPTAPLLKVNTANATEASNASDQSQIVARIRFIGS